MRYTKIKKFDVSHKEYKDRGKTEVAWNTIAKVLQERSRRVIKGKDRKVGVRTKGYSTVLLVDPTRVNQRNLVKSNGLSRVLMLIEPVDIFLGEE